MELRLYPSINDLPKAAWDASFSTGYPFLTHRFLEGLETSGSTGSQSGWQNCHLGLWHKDHPIALAPGFLKSHSYGEYVFDWSWADAWHRSGLDYYPKLVTGVPFTPATGPRLWTDNDHPDAQLELISAVTDWCASENISSWHILFPDETTSTQLATAGLMQRMTTQFHWFNRNYSDFDDFLSAFNSRKRKALKKERAAIAAQNLQLVTKTGSDISEEDWAFFYHCYQTTYLKRSGHQGYLTGDFFTKVCPQLGESTVMVIANEGEKPVAAALYFVDDDTLYGRYWGCLKEFDFLHFEACYYRGIEYCIERGISRFDPGAQGEHRYSVLRAHTHLFKPLGSRARLKTRLLTFAGETVITFVATGTKLPRYYPLSRSRNAKYCRLRWRLVTQKDPLRSFRVFLAKVVPGFVEGLERLGICNSVVDDVTRHDASRLLGEKRNHLVLTVLKILELWRDDVSV